MLPKYLEEVNWSDIIPEDLVEMHREKKGIEVYSDPEELFNPIAKRYILIIISKYSQSIIIIYNDT